ncbi:hypothetical protein F5X96DRAFT_641908 [Biscogniauxia mediterranea]|nr:hypothetical protein F5X96DRAFT_641908 [Biscogniauxia mediterranea]
MRVWKATLSSAWVYLLCTHVWLCPRLGLYVSTDLKENQNWRKIPLLRTPYHHQTPFMLAHYCGNFVLKYGFPGIEVLYTSLYQKAWLGEP